MTDTNNRKPMHRLYQVIGEGKTANWHPVGAAWQNRDGKGFSVALDAVPLTGRIAMREIEEKPEGTRQAGRA